MRVLLDTNIVLDIFQKRDFDRESLKQIFVMHHFGDVEVWVSANTYTDLFYFLRKELGSASAHDALLERTGWLRTCSIEDADIRSALEQRWPDFEDCLVNVCAEKIKADYLVTRDEEGFARSRIPHGSASAFMAFVLEQTNVQYDVEKG